MKTALTLALAATLALAGHANAESGFPKDFPAEVSGLAIGQPSEEAKAKLQALFPNDIEKAEKGPIEIGATYRVGDKFFESTVNLKNYPGEIPVGYMAGTVRETIDYGLSTKTHYTGNGASVLFSSPESGSKVEVISRDIIYDTPKDPDAVRKQVAEQFGEPHEIDEGWGYLYAFKDGAPMERPQRSPNRAYRQCANANNAIRDIQRHRVVEVLAPGYYDDYFSQSRFKPATTDTCHASLQVRFRTDINGLVTGVSFTFLDHKAMADDMPLLQAALEAAKPPAPTGDTNVEKF